MVVLSADQPFFLGGYLHLPHSVCASVYHPVAWCPFKKIKMNTNMKRLVKWSKVKLEIIKHDKSNELLASSVLTAHRWQQRSNFEGKEQN